MNVGEGFYFGSGAVFIAVGVALLMTRRHHPPALALSVYVLSLGTLYAFLAVVGRSTLSPTIQGILALVAAGGLAAFALLFPKRLSGRAWIDAGVAGAYGLAFILVLLWLNWRSGTSSFREMLSVGGSGTFVHLLGFHVIAIVSIAASFLLPLRARRLGREEAGSMRGLGMLAVAYLLVSPGGPFPGIVAAARGEAPVAQAAVVILGAVLSQSLWLLSTFGPHARAARNIILTLVALNIGLGALHHAAGDLVVPIGRLFSALSLAYAVVAGQIEGLDVKVRWGISRSTIAAAFVAVFFVASEGAQILFGSENPWVGLVAAGALVFAIAPLQRAAERLAAHAVPVGPGGAVAGTSLDPEEAYRRAVRLAVRDRALSGDEEVHLAELAEALGIGAGRAAAVLRDVKQESGVMS